jgi:hypothetical protein
MVWFTARYEFNDWALEKVRFSVQLAAALAVEYKID